MAEKCYAFSGVGNHKKFFETLEGPKKGREGGK
jgi:hypothetical protein